MKVEITFTESIKAEAGDKLYFDFDLRNSDDQAYAVLTPRDGEFKDQVSTWVEVFGPSEEDLY